MLKRAGFGWTTALCVAIAWGSAHAGCGSDSPGAGFPDQNPDGSVGGGDGGTVDPFGDSGFFGDGGGGPVTTIKIAPLDPTVDVTITNGVLTQTPLTFAASDGNGAILPVSWTLDRGELGAIAATGAFTAKGGVGGTGNVTARYQAITAKTTVTVRIKVIQNGAPPPPDGGAPDAGAGGAGGVGGEGNGPPVDPGTVGILNGPPPPTPPGSAAELGFLYPYDKTVWPRGILAPLLQWQTTHAVSAVYIHLTEKNFEFQGYYSGASLVHQPIDADAWRQATNSNSGDPLKVDVVVADAGKAYGPISQSYTIAPGVLKGTVYYNSYNSHLVGGGNGAVLAIKPGALGPQVAVPGTDTSCHVCHEVSSDGSTLYMQDQRDGTYATGASYDLRNNGAVIQTYTGAAASSDGSPNDRKFLWSGVYPDGTFAMTNSRHAREHNSLDSKLYDRTTGNAIASTGWSTAVTAAVTPIFSPDGKHLAFNFWEGPGGGGVVAGAGHSLAITDFDCGKPDAAGGCQGPYAFSGLRELYKDAGRYPGWPGFLPDSSGVVFHNTVTPGGCPDCELSTWQGSKAELWYVNAAGAAQPIRMDSLNGFSGGATYLPTNAQHPDDTSLNYEPTMNPIASGGFAWVVFSSRRIYGNVAAGDPYDNGNGTTPIPKKLWVAAIDLNPAPGKDPSHPAFYLPGQELNAGNLRGFWAVDPCHTNGTTCDTGDECCGGFCRQADDGGALVCQDQPPAGCSQEFENCKVTADCCGAPQGYTCINGRCARPVTK